MIERNLIAIDAVALKERGSLAMGPFGSRITVDNFVEAGVPVIRGGNLAGSRFHDDGFVFLTEQKADELRSANAAPLDIVFTHRGTVGEVALIPASARHRRYVISQSQMKLRCDPAVADPRYVYYWFVSPAGKYAILEHVSTTGVPALARPLTALRSIKLPLPNLSEQRAVADLLETLDEKVSLNAHSVRVLEDLARSAFGLRFAVLDPDQVPQGWTVASLGDHVEVSRGLSYNGAGLATQGIPLHNLDSIYEGGGYKYEGIKHYRGEYKDRHIVHAGDLLVANTEQGFELLLIGFPALVPQRFGDLSLFSHHLYRVRPKSGSWLTGRFLYLALMSPRLRQVIVGYSNGTTVNMLPVDALQRPRIAVPPIELVQRFDETVQPLFAKQEQLQLENETLAQLRDLLLPKLMSGEIRLKEGEKAVAETG